MVDRALGVLVLSCAPCISLPFPVRSSFSFVSVCFVRGTSIYVLYLGIFCRLVIYEKSFASLLVVVDGCADEQVPRGHCDPFTETGEGERLGASIWMPHDCKLLDLNCWRVGHSPVPRLPLSSQYFCDYTRLRVMRAHFILESR